MNNNNSPQHDTMKEHVLEQIRTGKVHMRPKFYFTLKVLALILTTVVALITSVLLLSYIVFSIRISGQAFLLGFGMQGLLLFFLLFPWKMLLLEIGLIVLLEWLLRHFRFGYRSPLIYTVAGVSSFVLALAFILAMTSLHQMLLKQAEARRLPVFGGFYKDLRRPPREMGVYRGLVTNIEGNTFTIREDIMGNDGTTTRKVLVPPNVEISTLIEIGDSVFVAGDMMNGAIKAYGIRKLILSEE